jgi:DNA polymerase I-like protein with 3'-5' exonuclease and polymerase domains
MILNADVKSLEIVVAGDLSRDTVLRQEILDKIDLHEVNRDRFKLGKGKPGRLVAKTLSFRILYGGGAFSFAHDPDFMGVSTSEKFWQGIIDEYYDKYQGIREWHSKLVQTAIRDGRLEIPSWRFFPFTPDYNRREPWPVTQIKNFVVQGFGADLVMLARLQAAKYLRESGLEGLLISTIHDSIVADAPEKNVEAIGRLLNQAVEDVPKLCKQVFGYEFSLPMTAECQYGPNKRDLKDLTFS